jgi:hypothetical protein
MSDTPGRCDEATHVCSFFEPLLRSHRQDARYVIEYRPVYDRYRFHMRSKYVAGAADEPDQGIPRRAVFAQLDPGYDRLGSARLVGQLALGHCGAGTCGTEEVGRARRGHD